MKNLVFLAFATTLLTASCMKGNMPEPERTCTTCESEYADRPGCDTVINKKPVQTPPSGE